MNSSGYSVHTEGLRKEYGAKVALNGLDLAVPRGTVLGLLGPNGAGKTTAVRILSTLLRPSAGRALVGGFDVTTDPYAVRRRIGLTGQNAAVDEILTARQNLEMFGRLFHIGRRAARRRAVELLEQFSLSDAADRPPSSFSGGMRRRLDLASSMVLAPEVLFLDEPTTGLDPRGRIEVWEAVRGLAREGTTVLLTTHYLDEADRLSDRVALIDHGRKVTEDTPAGLKRAVGGDRLEVVLQNPADRAVAAHAIARHTSGVEPRIDDDGTRVHGPVHDGVTALTEVARALREEGVQVEDLGLRRPTLDDVFLRLTGRAVDDATPGPDGDQDRPPPTDGVPAPAGAPASPTDHPTDPAGIPSASPVSPAPVGAAAQQKENDR